MFGLFRSKKKKKAGSSAQRRFSLESLESRQLLAGNVSVFSSGGSVYLTGDAAANDITIAAHPTIAGRITVTGNGGTLINNNAAPQVFTATADILIRMNSGNDVVTFTGDFNNDGALGNPGTVDGAPRDVLFDGGLGDNTFIMTDYRVNRTLRINNSTGFDTVTLTNVETSLTTMSNGNGGANITIDNLDDIDDVVAGQSRSSLTITNGNAPVGFPNILNLRNSLLSRATITNGNGPSITNVDNTIFDDLGSLLGDGDLTIRTGTGPATITLGFLAPNTYRDDVSVTTGAGATTLSMFNDTVGGSVVSRTGAGGTIATFDTVAIGDDLSVTNGNGDNVVTIIAANIGDDATIYNGIGNNMVTITDGVIGDDLLCTNCQTTVGGTRFVRLATTGPLDVGGDVTINNYDGNSVNEIGFAADMTVGGRLLITNGRGINLTELGSGLTTLNVTADVTVRGGDGQNTVNADGVAIGTDLNITNGNGTLGPNVVNIGTQGNLLGVIVGRDVLIRNATSTAMPGGDSTININNAFIVRNVTIDDRGNADVVNILAAGPLAAVTIGGTTKITTNGGDDIINLGVGGPGDGPTVFGGFVQVSAGSGDDVLTIGSNTTLTAPNFRLDGGTQNFQDVLFVSTAAFDVFDPINFALIANWELVFAF